MVYWITRLLGIKPAGEDLSPDDYGSVIIDVRDIKDGENELVKLINTLKKITAHLALERGRVILQCQAGMSRSPVLAIATLFLQYGLEWKDAEDLVKKKCPITQINKDLYDQVKKICGVQE